MKINTIGTITIDTGYEVEGVLLEGTREEIAEIARLYAAGVKDVMVAPMPQVTALVNKETP